MKDENNSNRRKFLRNVSAVAGISTLGLSGVASGKKYPGPRREYPVVETKYDDTPVGDIAIDAVKQPHHDRIAFTTIAFGDGYELYLAEGAASVENTPARIRQLTENSAIGVFDIRWKKGNRLQYWHDGGNYVRKIPLSSKIFVPEKLEDSPLPESLGGENGSNAQAVGSNATAQQLDADLPIPGGFSFEECVPIPKVLEFGTDEVCVSSDVLTDGTRDCATCASCGDGSTPPLLSLGSSLYEEDVNNNITYSYDLWIGVNLRFLTGSQKPVLWFGQEDSFFCLSENLNGEEVSIATLRDAAETLVEEIQENPEESAKDILVTLMLLLVVAFLVRKGIVKVLGRVPDLPGIPSPV
jgi:hypothetical protein